MILFFEKMGKHLCLVRKWLAFFSLKALKVEEIPEPQVLAERIFVLVPHRPSRPPLLLEQPGGGSP